MLKHKLKADEQVNNYKFLPAVRIIFEMEHKHRYLLFLKSLE